MPPTSPGQYSVEPRILTQSRMLTADEASKFLLFEAAKAAAHSRRVFLDQHDLPLVMEPSALQLHCSHAYSCCRVPVDYVFASRLHG